MKVSTMIVTLTFGNKDHAVCSSTYSYVKVNWRHQLVRDFGSGNFGSRELRIRLDILSKYQSKGSIFILII